MIARIVPFILVRKEGRNRVCDGNNAPPETTKNPDMKITTGQVVVFKVSAKCQCVCTGPKKKPTYRRRNPVYLFFLSCFVVATYECMSPRHPFEVQNALKPRGITGNSYQGRDRPS